MSQEWYGIYSDLLTFNMYNFLLKKPLDDQITSVSQKIWEVKPRCAFEDQEEYMCIYNFVEGGFYK